MKTQFTAVLFAMASTAVLPAAVTITVGNNAPNGIASGGTGSGSGAFSTSSGTIATDRGMPVTTYTVSNLNLTSLGGSASESFTFSVTYSQTGGTGVQFNGFGNVSVTGGDNNQVDGSETITANIALTSSTFAELSLTGFTLARGGGFGGAETATITWPGGGGGSFNASVGNTIASNVSGNSFTITPGSASSINLEGFEAQFVAVPEPTSLSLIALGGLALLRRRRTA